MKDYFTGRYGIYSIGVDRFILLDKIDFWTTLQTAKVLSSKLPTIVFCLGKDIIDIDSEDILRYSINENEKYLVHQSTNQTPSVEKIENSNSVIKTIDSKDYSDRKDILNDLVEYAYFTQRILYAVNMSDVMNNVDDHTFFANMLSEDIPLDVRSSTKSYMPNGIVNAVRKVLYLSSSVEQAMEEIDILFRNSKSRYKTDFYDLANVAKPMLRKNNLDLGSFTARRA